MTDTSFKDPGKSPRPQSDYHKNVVTAAKGGGISFIGKILEYLISLGFVFLMARMLGADQYGLYRIMVTVVSITAAICLIGLDGGLKRYIAIANKKQNTSELWGIIQIGLGIPSVVGLLVTVIILFSAEPLANQLFNKPDLVPILRIGALAIPFLILINSFSAISVGFKKMQFVLYGKDLSFNVSKLILSLLAIFTGMGLLGVTVAYILAALIGFLVLAFSIHRFFSLKRGIHTAERNVREIMNFSLPLFFTTVLNQFGRKFETIILGIYGIAASVGVFSAILAISQVGAMGYTALRNISSPIISELHSQNKIQDLEKYYQLITKWSLIFNLPFFLAILLLGDKMLLLFGEEYTVGSTGLIILASGTLVNAASGTCGTLINMTGYSKVNFYNSLIYLISTLALDFILIPKYELIGAAIAGSLSIIIVNTIRTIQVYYLVNKILPFNASFWKPLVATLLALVVTLVLRQLVFVQSPILQLVTLAVILVIVFFGTIILLKLSTEDRLIVDKVYQLIGRKKNGKKQRKKNLPN